MSFWKKHTGQKKTNYRFECCISITKITKFYLCEGRESSTSKHFKLSCLVQVCLLKQKHQKQLCWKELEFQGNEVVRKNSFVAEDVICWSWRVHHLFKTTRCLPNSVSKLMELKNSKLRFGSLPILWNLFTEVDSERYASSRNIKVLGKHFDRR